MNLNVCVTFGQQVVLFCHGLKKGTAKYTDVFHDNSKWWPPENFSSGHQIILSGSHEIILSGPAR